MFGKIVTSALFAGFCGGLLAGLLQWVFVQPVLLHAELYETGELVHFGGPAISAVQEFARFEILRDFKSVFFSVVTYSAYALLLIVGMGIAAERGVTVSARAGLLWGLAGYITFHLAPAFSLPPEVPGVASAEVGPRQIWWFATAAATAVGLALLAFGKSPLLWVLGAVLLLAPHVIGAPQPGSFAGTVPTELAALFAARALGVGFAAWALTGLFAGYFFARETAEG